MSKKHIKCRILYYSTFSPTHWDLQLSSMLRKITLDMNYVSCFARKPNARCAMQHMGLLKSMNCIMLSKLYASCQETIARSQHKWYAFFSYNYIIPYSRHKLPQQYTTILSHITSYKSYVYTNWNEATEIRLH